MNSIDIELLKKARGGNQDAIDTLLSMYKHLVVSISRKYYLMGGDKEDLIQEGMIGLFKAIISFDMNKNDNFTAYAVRVVEREMIDAIRRANTGSQQFLSESILIESDDELSDSASPEDDFISQECTDELSKEIYEHLSAFEQEVMEYYLKGYNYVDIAKLMGKTPKSIDNALGRIKKKLYYLKERL